MNKLVTSTVFGLGIMLGTLIINVDGASVKNAQAGNKCPQATNNACIAFLEAEIRSLKRKVDGGGHRVVQKQKRTNKTRVARNKTQKRQTGGGEKSCVVMYQKDTSSLVAYVGEYRNAMDEAKVIASATPNWTPVGGGIYKATFCIAKAKMVDVSIFTICGSVGHYTFNRTETGQFKRQTGPLGGDDIARMWAGG